MSDEYLADPLWGDAPEELPDGGFVLVREIKKALAGEDFKYIPEGEKRQVPVPGVETEAFAYYYQNFRYYQKFGLPHGSGWINELSWVCDFLSYMDDMYNFAVAWRSRQKPKK